MTPREGAGQDDLPAVAGRSGWIVSDGKAGNEAQCLGVFEALALAYSVKRVEPKGIWRALAPWGPVDPGERFGSPASQFAPPWPDFAIAAGRLTTPYIRRLKRGAGPATYTIVLMDPRVGAGAADLFWVPEHDRLRGPNVLTTLTAPHRFTPRRIAELRAAMPPEIAALPSPRVAVLLGGPNREYRYSPAAFARLGAALQSVAALGAGLMITASRRTPADLVDFLRTALGEAKTFFWNGAGESPYAQFLAHADAFIAPGDSVNMIGEPCVTGRPIYVFEPEGGGSAKFARFRAALNEHGATRPMPEKFERLDTWSYPPLSSAEAIAAEVARRWVRRRRMLGSMAAGRA